jgi:hypothetical protein
MRWPNRSEQRGLILLLAALVALSIVRACIDRPAATATLRQTANRPAIPCPV